MAETEIVTVRVPKEVAGKLAMLAKTTKRSKNYHAARAVEGYLRWEMEYVDKIEEGLESLDNGGGIPHERAMAIMNEYVDSLLERRKQ